MQLKLYKIYATKKNHFICYDQLKQNYKTIQQHKESTKKIL